MPKLPPIKSKKEFLKRFQERPLSWSQLSSFEYDPEQWYSSYMLGIREPANPAMEFGTLIGDAIGTDDNPVAGLDPVGTKEFRLTGHLDEILMVGYADHYCPKTFHLEENKTSTNHKRWTKKKADEHGQLTMYALMLFLRDKVPPEKVTMSLNFIRANIGQDFIYRLVEGDDMYEQFPTKRTTQQVVEFSAWIIEMVDKMYEYQRSR